MRINLSKPSTLFSLTLFTLPLRSHASLVPIPPPTQPVPLTLLHPRTSLSTHVDICASIDVSIKVAVLPPLLFVSLSVQTCLCIDAVVDFAAETCRTKRWGETAKADLAKKLSDEINKSHSRKTCSYPSNCQPVCTKSNPCGFHCKPGYKPSTDMSGNQICVCDTGTYSCNGVCKPNGQACPTGGMTNNPPHGKRRVNTGGWRRPACGKGMTVCGVYETGKGQGWECVDTKRDLESCGGCSILYFASSIPGRDCTQIPNILDVACVRSQCRVARCERGFAIGPDGSSCVPARRHSSPLRLNGHGHGASR